MKKNDKPISPAELKILNILWENSPLSASQIIEELETVESWHDRTVKSLITRLVKKKVVHYKQEDNRYLYYPVLKKNDYLQVASHHFIKRIFGGKISPLVAYFAKNEKLSKEDIQELKAILKELDSND